MAVMRDAAARLQTDQLGLGPALFHQNHGAHAGTGELPAGTALQRHIPHRGRQAENFVEALARSLGRAPCRLIANARFQGRFAKPGFFCVKRGEHLAQRFVTQRHRRCHLQHHPGKGFSGGALARHAWIHACLCIEQQAHRA